MAASDQPSSSSTAPHSSVLTAGSDSSSLSVGLKQCVTANCCGNKVHCPLCPGDLYTPTEFLETSKHLVKHHINKATEVNGYLCLLCKLPCERHPHFHCPSCSFTSKYISVLLKHHEQCKYISDWNSMWALLPFESGKGINELIKELKIEPGKDIQPPVKTFNHPSIVLRLTDLAVPRCRTCCDNYHCPICPPESIKSARPARMAEHIYLAHWKRRLQINNINILKCTMVSCLRNPHRFAQSHYHCVLCTKVTLTIARAKEHHDCHKRGTVKKQRVESSNAPVVDTSGMNVYGDEDLQELLCESPAEVTDDDDELIQIVEEEEDEEETTRVIDCPNVNIRFLTMAPEDNELISLHASESPEPITKQAEKHFITLEQNEYIVEGQGAEQSQENECIMEEIKQGDNSGIELQQHEYILFSESENVPEHQNDSQAVHEVVMEEINGQKQIIQYIVTDAPSNDQGTEQGYIMKEVQGQEAYIVNEEPSQEYVMTHELATDQSDAAVYHDASLDKEDRVYVHQDTSQRKEDDKPLQVPTKVTCDIGTQVESFDFLDLDAGVEVDDKREKYDVFEDVAGVLSKRLLHSLSKKSMLLEALHKKIGLTSQDGGGDRVSVRGKWWQMACAHMILEEIRDAKPSTTKQLAQILSQDYQDEKDEGASSDLSSFTVMDEATGDKTHIEAPATESFFEAAGTKSLTDIKALIEAEGRRKKGRPRKQIKEAASTTTDSFTTSVSTYPLSPTATNRLVVIEPAVTRAKKRKLDVEDSVQEPCEEIGAEKTSVDKMHVEERDDDDDDDGTADFNEEGETEGIADTNTRGKKWGVSKERLQEIQRCIVTLPPKPDIKAETEIITTTSESMQTTQNADTWNIEIELTKEDSSAYDSNNADHTELQDEGGVNEQTENMKEEQQENDENSDNDTGEVQGRILFDVDCPEAKDNDFRTCVNCDMVFNSRPEFFYHILESKSYECSKYKLKDYPYKLRTQLTNMKKFQSTKCSFCKVRFQTLNDGKVHTALRICRPKRLHNPQKIPRDPVTGLFMCTSCEFRNKIPANVVSHIGYKHAARTVPCEYCDRKFGSKKLLDRHVTFIHMDKGKEPCYICGKEVLSKYLRKHVKDVHLTKGTGHQLRKLAEPLSCPEPGCSYTSLHQDVMKKHKKRMHGVKDKACDICGATFAFLGDLNAHKKIHKQIPGRAEVNCPNCDKVMMQQNLAVHMRSVHEQKRLYTCEVCQKSFTTKYVLNCHVETHKKPSDRTYRFICDFCGAGFTNKTIYSDHLNTHTGQRPYKCPTCGKCFKQTSVFHKHLELHSNVKYFCAPCNEMFPNKRAYSTHKQSAHVQSLKMWKDAMGDFQQQQQQQQQLQLQHKSESVTLSMEQATALLTSHGNIQSNQILIRPDDEGITISDDGQVTQAEIPPTQSLVTLEDGTVVLVEGDLSQSAVEEGIVSEIVGPEGMIVSSIEHENIEGTVLHIRAEDMSQVHQEEISMDTVMEENTGSFQCGHCQELFADIESIQNHIALYHQEETMQPQEKGVEMVEVAEYIGENIVDDDGQETFVVNQNMQ